MNENIGQVMASIEGTAKQSPFSDKRYLVKVSGRTIGIYPLEFVIKAVRLKYFSGDDYAKRTGETHWSPLRQIPELGGTFESGKVLPRNTLTQERRTQEKLANLLGPFQI